MQTCMAIQQVCATGVYEGACSASPCWQMCHVALTSVCCGRETWCGLVERTGVVHLMHARDAVVWFPVRCAAYDVWLCMVWYGVGTVSGGLIMTGMIRQYLKFIGAIGTHWHGRICVG